MYRFTKIKSVKKRSYQQGMSKLSEGHFQTLFAKCTNSVSLLAVFSAREIIFWVFGSIFQIFIVRKNKLGSRNVFDGERPSFQRCLLHTLFSANFGQSLPGICIFCFSKEGFSGCNKIIQGAKNIQPKISLIKRFINKFGCCPWLPF